MIFEYNEQAVFTGSLDVVDPGNMCLRCLSDDGSESFIFTKSILGKVSVLKIGPILEDFPALLNGFSVMYKNFDYKENTIAKEVQTFINDAKKKITLVEEILPEEAYNIIPNILDLFKTQDLGE